jgi:hypothetical protein
LKASAFVAVGLSELFNGYFSLAVMQEPSASFGTFPELGAIFGMSGQITSRVS